MKKRLLVTDPFTPQSYDILLSLKDICEHIVVMVPPLGIFPRLFSFTANSKVVNKCVSSRYYYRIPIDELVNPVYGANNCDEQKHVDEILAVCKTEKINLIYPSDDFEILLLSKYKKVFYDQGIEVPINSFEILKQLFDKDSVINLARHYQIPHPSTVRMDEWRGSEDDMEPFIIKPRFGSAARDIFTGSNMDSLMKWKCDHENNLTDYVFQNFIPGDTMYYFRVYLSRDGTLIHSSCSQCKRPEMIIHQSRGLLVQNCADPPCAGQIIQLFRELGYVGYAHAQLKLDFNDTVTKIIEINPRISRGTWTEHYSLINGPVLSLELFEGKKGHVNQYIDRRDIFFVWPMQDFVILIWSLIRKIIQQIKRVLISSCRGDYGIMPTIRELLVHYSAIYLSHKKKVCDNYCKRFFKDPFVSITYWVSFCYALFKDSK